ncbi:MAG: enoyl-CoA hydratase-related protein [Candidatus Rokuibacteriota bacterium]
MAPEHDEAGGAVGNDGELSGAPRNAFQAAANGDDLIFVSATVYNLYPGSLYNNVTGSTGSDKLIMFGATETSDAATLTGSVDLGAGGDTFDSAARGRAATAEEHRDGGGTVTLRIFDMKKPVIAAINGPAVGFGITLTLPMDIRIASSAARIGFVFARRGVVPEACSTWFLPRLVGISQAAEWVYTGRVFSAEEALAGRLVSRVVAPDALLSTARHLAREIADNASAISVTLARQMMWKLLGADHPIEAHLLDSQAMFWTGRSADAREGITAFLEKRPARFALRPSADLPPFYPWWRSHKSSPSRD